MEIVKTNDDENNIKEIVKACIQIRLNKNIDADPVLVSKLKSGIGKKTYFKIIDAFDKVKENFKVSRDNNDRKPFTLQNIVESIVIIIKPKKEIKTAFIALYAEPKISVQPLDLWAWLPLPTQNVEPDFHEEFSANTGILPNDLIYYAARARGKKHKHEGTHCDDWYEVSEIGQWSLIAVSDGAGSKRISRVGAKVSTNEAIVFLKRKLESVPIPKLQTRLEWGEALKRDKQGYFLSAELKILQEALTGAVKVGFDAIKQALEIRQTDSSWDMALGRSPELKDFRSTFLITLLCTVAFENENRTLCLSLQIGDGLTIMYLKDENCSFQPLAAKDSGEYSSETEFLVDFKKWEELPAKIGVTVVPMKMFVSMTDGVDDIYDPRTGRDYNWILGELILNQVLPIKCEPNLIDKAIKEIGGNGIIREAIKIATQPRKKRLMSPPEEDIIILDIGLYAEHLKKNIVDLIIHPELLLLAHKFVKPISIKSSIESRLLSWLDGKDVKGEFDDRTIVIIIPKGGLII